MLINRPLVSRYPILILIGLFLSVFRTTSHAQAPKFELYYAMKDLSRRETGYLDENGFRKAKLVYQQSIDPDDDTRLNEDVFRSEIISEFHLDERRVIGVLDWEGRAFKELVNPSVSEARKGAIINEFLKALRIAKKLRPNVKWGFYGIPLREYWHRNEEWVMSSMRFLSLLSECDYIAPSLYKLYRDEVENLYSIKGFAEDNIRLSLRIGDTLNKPVYPFIWHRWHNGNRRDGLKLIPQQEFIKFIQKICKQNYRDRRISGFIWWSNDKRMFRTKFYLDQLDKFEKEYTLENDSYRIVKRYTLFIKSALNEFE